MCEAHEIASDGKTWTFRLRPGLRFHDNEPVRAANAIASIKRWMQRDVMAGRLKCRFKNFCCNVNDLITGRIYLCLRKFSNFRRECLDPLGGRLVTF